MASRLARACLAVIAFLTLCGCSTPPDFQATHDAVDELALDSVGDLTYDYWNWNLGGATRTVFVVAEGSRDDVERRMER